MNWWEETVHALVVPHQRENQQFDGVASRRRRAFRLMDNSPEGVT
jgi:hypothetical protein